MGTFHVSVRRASVLASLMLATAAQADEGGVSFWLPGQFGSLAAVPTAPGWSLPTIYIHSSESLGADKTTIRGGRLTAGVDATADIVLALPTYTFETPVWGGQAAIAAGAGVGNIDVSVDATFNRPGGPIVSGHEQDSKLGGTDFYALGTLKWNFGVHNVMAYSMLGAPAGAYQAGRISNLGIGHWSIDAGGGYTYFDKVNEFSAVMGFTYNFENPDTHYKNGIDAHIDWAASRFVTKETHLGVVGYFYHQITGDSGEGASLGDYKSRVNAIGLQVGHFFPVGKEPWYVNLKGFHEFGAKNRPEGWSVWLTLLIPLGPAKKP